MEKFHGHTFSKQTVSIITKTAEVNVKSNHERTFTKRNAVLFCDVTIIYVRRGTVAKVAVHSIVGISDDGYKDALDYRLFLAYDSSNYTESLEDLRGRGLTEVLLIITDGIKEIKDSSTTSS